jgi:hypothetical protein
MGYSIYQLKSEFFIPNHVQSDALFSIKNLIREFSTSGKHIAFVETTEIEQSEFLEDALLALRWIPEVNENGDIVGVEFSGEKLGDDYQIFNSIAVYVKENSFLTFVGEDSKVSRWLFLNGEVTEQIGILTFES